MEKRLYQECKHLDGDNGIPKLTDGLCPKCKSEIKSQEEIIQDDYFVYYGSEVKAEKNGVVSGYLVRFSDENNPDLAGDFFTKDTDFGSHKTSPTLYHHGMDVKIGNRVLGNGELKTDETGVWIQAQLEMRDAYERAIYEMAQKGKLGWSSGTASHLVRRKRVGNANKITAWQLGLDASLTPTPAEPRNSVFSAKSISVKSLDELITNNIPDKTGEEETMEKQEIDALVEQKLQSALKAKADEEAAIKSAEAKAKEQEDELQKKVQDAVKSALTKKRPVNDGAPALNKTGLGDDAFKAFNHWIKTGDNGGLRAGDEYKTAYDLVEGTQYQGQELVPTEVLNKIYEFRNPLSIARAAGANVITVGSNATTVPIQKARLSKFAIVSEAAAYDENDVQPVDKKSVTQYKFTKLVQISEELLEDSVVDVTGFFSRIAGAALADTENYYFVSVGTGSSQPQAALVGSTLGVTAASATAITAAELMSLYHKLPAEYRDKAVWVMKGATEGTLRGLSGNPFYFAGNGGTNGGVGNTGVPQGAGWLISPTSRVFNDGNMPAMTTGLKSVLVGNFEAGYVILERRALTVKRNPYAHSGSGLLDIEMSVRMGGAVAIGESFHHLIQA